MRQQHIIGFDATVAASDIGARGHYGRFVISAIAAAHSRNSFFRMYAQEHDENSAYKAIGERHNIEALLPDGGIYRRLGWLWRKFGIARDAKRGNVELFHGLAGKLPYGLSHYDIRSVVTIHDLRHIHNTDEHSPIATAIHKLQYRSTCRRADRIVATSEYIKEELIDTLNIDAEKIDVIYPGCSNEFTHPVTEAAYQSVAEKYHLPEHYILAVGLIDRNANIELLVDALAKSTSEIDLVVAGIATSDIEHIKSRIEELGIAPRIHFLHGVSEEDMPAIFHGAEIFACTTIYEGFNHHIVEAATMGKPIVATTETGHEEAGGPNQAYVSNDNCDDLAAAIDGILTNSALREDMSQKAKIHAQRFRPEVVAYNIAKCYKRIGIDITE
jgi:glycosyltransferase involved in cell wall biosynthesis